MTDAQRGAWDTSYGPENKAFLSADLKGDALVRWRYQRYIKDYLRTGLSVDESVNSIVEELDSLGLAENTIIFYCSDQGFFLGEHGWFDKRNMYEETFRAPLIAKWPGKIAPGSVNDDLTQNIDLAETFLDLAVVPAPDTMQGESLVPLLMGNTPKTWRNSLYYHYYLYPGGGAILKHEGVATKDLKLIRYYGKDTLGGEEWEFYDRTQDPAEMKNQYGNSEYAEQVATLKKELQALRKQYDVD